ncbi:hypothetical protein B0H13DRAFT_1853046 [Mycena leptocephala]|nr:hypothetical protein B0H13DRAFT_1853046 [Mycena leptocephala]
MQLMALGVTTWIVFNMIPVLVFEPVAGVCTFTSKPSVFGLWVPGIVFEVVIFATVCWNVLDRPRAVGADAHITRILFRDGLVYFAVRAWLHFIDPPVLPEVQILTVLRVANTVIAVVSPISSLFVIIFFVWAATTLTTSRLIINSRRENGRAAQLWEGQMEDVDVDTSEHEHLDERQSTKSFWV